VETIDIKNQLLSISAIFLYENQLHRILYRV